MEYHSGGSLPLLGRPRYCPGAKATGGYLCETGHCCGETGCCTYYYELWWFWLLWTVLILFSCCCAYRHRRAKLRLQQQRRQQETSLLAYHGATSYPSSMLDLSFLASLKLPSYEEVAAQPSTPPPPYSSVFTTPRYPQPPRTADPHLLTHHQGPLLHRRLSDGPSSFSSDNSSSCSCDSCCPSSLCSSSISAPITYETDTSHATTPSEATPLTLEVKVENVAAASCLEIKEMRAAAADASDEEASGASSPLPTESLLQKSPSPAVTELTLPIISTSPTRHQDPRAGLQSVNTFTAYSPSVIEAKVLIQIKSSEGPTDGPTKTPAIKVTSLSRASSPAFSNPDSPTSPHNLSRTFDHNSGPSPVSVPRPNYGRTLVLRAGSPEHPAPGSAPSDHSPCLDPAMLTVGQASVLEFQAAHIPPITNLPQNPEETAPTTVQDSDVELSQGSDTAGPNEPNLQTRLDHCGAATPEPAEAEPALTSPTSSSYLSPDLGCKSVLVQEPPKPGQHADPASKPNPLLVSSQLCPKGHVSCPECGPFPLVASVPVLQSSPAITIEAESSVVPSPPASLSSPSPPSLPSPPAITSSSLPATILLLDPFSGPHQVNKGGSSSGHASSLSPSPRTTQSPPKQTLFSPCVDVFEPEPLSWEDEEEEQEEVEDDEEDVGADESQYRHRRLTGDSGIEVCRCQVDEDGEGEEFEQKERNQRGVDGEREKKGSANTDLHDSEDCPARSQRTREEGHTSTSPPTSESSDIIVTETV